MERLVYISANGRWLSSVGRVGSRVAHPRYAHHAVHRRAAPHRTALQAPHCRHRTAGVAPQALHRIALPSSHRLRVRVSTLQYALAADLFPSSIGLTSHVSLSTTRMPVT
jgi:hypothetical protein